MSKPLSLSDFDISPLALLPSSPSYSSSSDLSLSDHENDYDCERSSTEEGEDYEEDDTSSSLASCTDPVCCPPSSPSREPSKPSSTSSSSSILTVPSDSFHPLLIIGAGPHSLALAARLSESRPAALYTDLEHARLDWLQRDQLDRDEKKKKKKKKKVVKGHWGVRKLVEPEKVTLARGETTSDCEEGGYRGIKVLDSTSDQWLGRWNNYFKGLRIKTLRSPMLFHPSPADVDALVAYARRERREDELTEIEGVVGKELSKHAKKKKRGQNSPRVNGTVPINERDRQDYFRPSSSLFDSFISSELISRYSLSSLVTHSTVTQISYTMIQIEGESEPIRGFVVESRDPDGTTSIMAAEAVVVAPGPSNLPNIPQVIRDALPPSRPRRVKAEAQTGPWNENEIRGENWCHSSAFSIGGFSPLNDESLLGQKVQRGEESTALVIGGGLTSIQITDSLLSQGVSKVYLICRSFIKIKHFDFPLSWVSKYNNLEKASFWNSDCHQDRYNLIQAARDGGSVNPEFYRLLHKYIKLGKVELKTLSQVTKAQFDQGWTIRGETFAAPPSRKRRDSCPVEKEPTKWNLEGIDYLVCSTGSKLSIDESLPFLDNIQRQFPIEKVGGLPCLTESLQWSKEVPLFMVGAFSMLELGPDALNLSGCRTGAERVAHRLGELGIFETFRRGRTSRHQEEEETSSVSVREEKAVLERSRMEEKQYRSGGEGNFFRGLSVGIEV
ncbi:hypothetical protein JCM3765_004537 [Sporobolomyces pararoseus]